jgi:hypothetical protein
MNKLIHKVIITPGGPEILNQPYVGPDIHGRQVSGTIVHVGKYADGSVPVTYVVALNEPIGDERTVQVSAELIAQHIHDLDLVESMKRDAE